MAEYGCNIACQVLSEAHIIGVMTSFAFSIKYHSIDHGKSCFIITYSYTNPFSKKGYDNNHHLVPVGPR
jgi:hypothetical protein